MSASCEENLLTAMNESFEEPFSYQSAILSEVGVLRVICEETIEVDDEAAPSKVCITLHPATAGNKDAQFVCLTLLIQVPEEYPDVAPTFRLKNPRGMSEEELERISKCLKQIADDRRGSEMLYDVIQAAKDSLTENNSPSLPCVICQCSFNEGDDFTKTECYHYFHSFCLGRYLEFSHEQNEEITCPICRTPISSTDLSQLKQAPEPDDDSSPKVEITAETLQWQEEMRVLFERQKANGGHIDVEAESKRHLISIRHTPTTSMEEMLSQQLRNSTSISKEHDQSEQDHMKPDREHTKEHWRRDKTLSYTEDRRDYRNWQRGHEVRHERPRGPGRRGCPPSSHYRGGDRAGAGNRNNPLMAERKQSGGKYDGHIQRRKEIDGYQRRREDTREENGQVEESSREKGESKPMSQRDKVKYGTRKGIDNGTSQNEKRGSINGNKVESSSDCSKAEDTVYDSTPRFIRNSDRGSRVESDRIDIQESPRDRRGRGGRGGRERGCNQDNIPNHKESEKKMVDDSSESLGKRECEDRSQRRKTSDGTQRQVANEYESRCTEHSSPHRVKEEGKYRRERGRGGRIGSSTDRRKEDEKRTEHIHGGSKMGHSPKSHFRNHHEDDSRNKADIKWCGRKGGRNHTGDSMQLSNEHGNLKRQAAPMMQKQSGRSVQSKDEDLNVALRPPPGFSVMTNSSDNDQKRKTKPPPGFEEFR